MISSIVSLYSEILLSKSNEDSLTVSYDEIIFKQNSHVQVIVEDISKFYVLSQLSKYNRF